MVRAVKCVLVQCDPSIKALILDIDRLSQTIVIQDLDDTHLVIDSSKVQHVKNELNRLLTKNVYNPMEEEEQP
ncbi:hypothetical protein BABINDRAFT_163195 [Babjeviella inositovora NRRL Y-12698]|uniref:General transcription and DNA repair factor IIH subunit TFB5 n=1 Tax=Babjeviella inositovora NRRL Y-12698 TaxID=984486 RepID=A0A1E3QJL1_9ASCO|nr:uncharacterized protein BABINDRAFT_163195 [Babjeviella inositovora NRRL Y-12698]ODQ77808.1 hypothetical protein BABINDRAFT_163195 [Babjeviella inositovora NRRL Y-12698]